MRLKVYYSKNLISLYENIIFWNILAFNKFIHSIQVTSDIQVKGYDKILFLKS